MYPEAGGSSSFARHAFNEFWGFFAAWAQMLNYTITIAISAFFVPHYLGGLLGSTRCATGPGDIVFAIGVIALLSRRQRPRRQGVRRASTSAWRSSTSSRSCCSCRRPVPRLQPRHADRQRPPRRRADVEGLLHRDPGRR